MATVVGLVVGLVLVVVVWVECYSEPVYLHIIKHQEKPQTNGQNLSQLVNFDHLI